MEERFEVPGTTTDGIFFPEDGMPNARVRSQIHVEISRQNANLSEVKRRMAREARAVGAAAVMDFRYGQKPHAWWELVLTFRWDTESWHGDGDAIQSGSARESNPTMQ